MKLNPPDSSSDLEAAREIALRLNQHKHRGGAQAPFPPASPRVDIPSAPPRPAATPPRSATPPPLPPPRPASRPPQSLEPPPLPSAPPLRVTPPPPPSAPFEPEPAWGQAPPSDDLDIAVPLVSPNESMGPEVGSPFDDAAEADLRAGPVPLEVEIEEPPAPPGFQDLTGEPSPFDTELSEPVETAPDDLFGTPPPPSWDEVIEACFEVSQASGAMLIDPAGQVFAARGEWPDPGAEAIAAKLVPMLDRTLRDAPTRSVSAPVAGRHLTAWRVSLAEGLVTVAFVGHAPLRAELRPVIDEQIHRGAGA